MKKLISLMLALILVVSMATVVFAGTAQDAKFTKTYKLSNDGTENPAETFTFSFTADSVSDAEVAIKVDNMPSIPNSTVSFDKGEASKAGDSNNVDVALSNINWPGVGVYVYKVAEVVPDTKTLGVGYSTKEGYLKVTVVHNTDDNGNIIDGNYYVAFVTMSLADDNVDGQTDTKSGDFENTYSAGSLNVKKTVTGAMGDKTKEFEIYVTFKNETNQALKSDIYYTVGTEKKTISADNVTDDDGYTVTLQLKDDASVTFTNIPYGLSYSVSEKSYADEGYSVSYDAKQNGKINAAETKTVVTNTKDGNIDTGITLDSVPFILMLVVCAGAAVLFITKRRSVEF